MMEGTKQISSKLKKTTDITLLFAIIVFNVFYGETSSRKYHIHTVSLRYVYACARLDGSLLQTTFRIHRIYEASHQCVYIIIVII